MKKIGFVLMMLGAMPVMAQNWDMNKVPPKMQEVMASCYAIYQRTEDQGRLYHNTDILKKLGIHDQIMTHPAYQEGKEMPFKSITREQRETCKMMVYGMIGSAEMLFTGKQPKYPKPNMHYCLGYYKSVFDRGDAEKAYCKEDVCRDREIVGCVDKCVKKVHEFKSFKMGLADGKMLDYKQLTACVPVMTNGK